MKQLGLESIVFDLRMETYFETNSKRSQIFQSFIFHMDVIFDYRYREKISIPDSFYFTIWASLFFHTIAK